MTLDCRIKTSEIELELLSDIYMLLMSEEGIQDGVCLAVLRLVKAKNKYMKTYDKNKDLSFLMYSQENNLCEKAMS